MSSSQHSAAEERQKELDESSLRCIQNAVSKLDGRTAYQIIRAQYDLRRCVDKIPLTKDQRLEIEDLLSTVELATHTPDAT